MDDGCLVAALLALLLCHRWYADLLFLVLAQILYWGTLVVKVGDREQLERQRMPSLHIW